jgi:hypothetical protein
MLSRFGVNMNKMGLVYNDLVKVLFEATPKNMQEEAQKLAELGNQAGKMLRIALSFDMYTERPDLFNKD